MLPSIDEECWVPAVQETDALLVWGGDPVFLSYWMRRSGLADVLPSLPSETVYLGVSAGSIAATSTFAETYREPRRGSGEALSTEDIVFDTPDGELRMILVKAQGVGLVDFAIIPHVDNADHQDMAIAEQWAARIPAPTYAIDDQTAIKVTDGNVEVVSEGHWKLFTPKYRGSADSFGLWPFWLKRGESWVRRVNRALRLTAPPAVHSGRSILRSPVPRVLGLSLSSGPCPRSAVRWHPTIASIILTKRNRAAQNGAPAS